MKFFRPTLEELEPKIVPSAITDREIRTMLEAMSRTRRTLAAPRTIIAPRASAQASGAAQRSSSGGGSRALVLPSGGGSIRPVNKKVYSMETSFLVHDPALHLAGSALSDNTLANTIFELAGQGSRDKKTGRFVSSQKKRPEAPKPPESKRPTPPKKPPTPIKLPEIIMEEDIEEPPQQNEEPRVEPKNDP